MYQVAWSTRLWSLSYSRENMGDLVVLWLDLAYAYDSMPHKLVSIGSTSSDGTDWRLEASQTAPFPWYYLLWR